MSSEDPTSRPADLFPEEKSSSPPAKKTTTRKGTKKTARKTSKKTAKKASKQREEKSPKAEETLPAQEAAAPLAAAASATTPDSQSVEPISPIPSSPPTQTKEENGHERKDAKEAKEPTQASSPEEGPPTKREPRGHKDGKRPPREPKKRKEIVLTGDPLEVRGLLELAPKGYGFLRCPEKGYEQARDDVFVPPEFIQKHGIRHCMWLEGQAKMGPKGLQLIAVETVNATPVSEYEQGPFFEDLKAINPEKRISFETDSQCFTTRVLDLVSPVGRGQRGLIVAPPRSGKTTFLMDIAKALQERHEDTIHPIFLLIDERPEEVTEFKRNLPEIEMFASSNDSGNRNHCRIAELCIERAKRLVEQGQHVFILMDSITRLARAYNRSSDGGKGSKGRGYQSGGLVSGALEVPRRLFAAARNTREGGSLTILATALVQTNSKADEAIFQEFKGTGNMEIVLDRRLADHYIYPAVDLFKSGTRREELLLPEMTLRKFHLIRRGLRGHRPNEAMERLLFFLKKFHNNAQMLLEIKG